MDTELQQVVADFQAHKQRVIGKVSTLQVLLKMNAQKAKLQTEALEEELKTKDSECKRLQNFLQTRKDKSSKLETQVEELQERLQSMPEFDQDSLKLHTENTEIKRENKKLMVQNDDLRHQVATLKDNAKEAKTRNSMLSTDLDKLRNLLDIEKAKTKKLETDLKNMGFINSILKQECSAMRKDAVLREFKVRTVLEMANRRMEAMSPPTYGDMGTQCAEECAEAT